MEKIISVFQRNYGGDYLVRDEVVPGAEWVLAGEGRATRKWDGTCCKIEGGKLYKRHDVHPGKNTPSGFEAAQDPDPVTGHIPGWLPVGDGPEDRWFREGLANSTYEAIGGTAPFDGTYELIGPHVNGNPEGHTKEVLAIHGAETLTDFPRTFEGVREWFTKNPTLEGVVFWHPDGRMAKVKLKDFGIRRIMT